MKYKVDIIEQGSYKLTEIVAKLSTSLAELGVLKALEVVQSVLLKPNLLGAFEPEKNVTTHPVIIEAVIVILQEMGKTIYIADSPGGTIPYEAVLKKTGIRDLVDKYKINWLQFGQNGIETVERKGGESLYFDPIINKIDAIINLPKYKTHSLMLYTGAIKNLFGLIPGIKKSEYHKYYPDYASFSGLLNDLYRAVEHKIVVNIMDGVIGMQGEGPSAGQSYEFHRIFVSQDAPALDYIAAGMMGFQKEEMGYILEGRSDLNISNVEIKEEYRRFVYQDVNIKIVRSRYNFLKIVPNAVFKVFSRLFSAYPEILDIKCVKCRICQKSCPVQAIEDVKDRLKIRKGKCIKCLCCHEFCPHRAIKVRKSLLARLL